jgi:hypothetical protein
MGQQRLRREVGQWVVVTCRETGQSFRICLASVHSAHSPSGVLTFDDPDDAFDVETVTPVRTGRRASA